MTFRTERCAVGNNTVTLVADYEGTITMVICPDYQYGTGACARRRRGPDRGPLTDFIDRVTPHSAADEATRCIYWPA